MPTGFPPQPVYPYGIDSESTLYLVYNTSEAALSANNEPWAEEVPVVPRQPGQTEIWADNGFATISGEMFYYDAVDKNSDGYVYNLKRCVRNLGGVHTQPNQAGTMVRGFVMAEHHNQIVDCIMRIENFVGENFSPSTPTLDWRIRHLQLVPIIFDDFDCPDVSFTFNIVSDDPASGVVANYFIQITGTFNSFVLDFGDGTFTRSVAPGTHQYAPNAIVDPVITIANDQCQIVQTPIQRTQTATPQQVPDDSSIDIPIPTCPDIGNVLIPSVVVPEPDVIIPPLVFPCVNVSPFPSTFFGPISIAVDFTPIDIPSEIIITPIVNIPSVISITTPSIPNPSLIVPSIQDVKVDVPSIPDIKVDVPSIPAITVDVPTIPNITVDVPTIPNIGVDVPTIPNIGVDVPTIPNITVDVPNIPTNITITGPDIPTNITITPVDIPNHIDVTPINVPTHIDVTPIDIPANITITGPDIPANITITPVDIPNHIDVTPVDIPNQIDVTPIDIPAHIDVQTPDIPVHIDVQTPDIPNHIDIQNPDIPVHIDVQTPDIPDHIDVSFPPDVPELEVSFPADIPSVEVEFPADIPSLDVEFPVDIPTIDVEFPADIPSIDVEFPADIPPIEVEFPVDIPPIEVQFPEEIPPIEVEFPPDIPPIDVEFPADIPPIEVEFPADIPPIEVEFPVDIPPIDVEFPADIPPIDVEFPADIPSIEVEFPADIPPIEVEFPADIPPIAVEFPADIPTVHVVFPVDIPNISLIVPSIPNISLVVPSTWPSIPIGSFPNAPSIPFGPAPTFPCITFCSPPTVPVGWGSPPTIPINVTVTCNCQCCPSSAALNFAEPEFAEEFSPFTPNQNWTQPEQMEINYDFQGFPSVITFEPPVIPDVKIVHDLPSRIELFAPEKMVIEYLGPVIPSQIELIKPVEPMKLVLEGPSIFKLDTSGLDGGISLIAPERLPTLVIDASMIPSAIQVVGVPSVIELIHNLPSVLEMKMPENATVQMLPPKEAIPVSVMVTLAVDGIQKILADQQQQIQCVAIVPCPMK